MFIPACLDAAPAVICIPLVDQNQSISFIWLGRKTPFTEFDVRSLDVVSGIAANALQRAITLETLEQRVADRTRELATLYNVATIITEEHELTPILKRSLSLTLETLNSQQGMIHLVGEPEGQISPETALFLAVDKGFNDQERDVIINPPPESNYPAVVLASNQSVFRSNPSTDLRNPRSYLGVPMRIRGNEVIGVISVYRAIDTFFSTEEIALLSTVADEIAVMIENVRLRKQAEQGAVLEERQRLARELHDSATQALYSLTLFASAGKELAQKGDLIRLRSTIERINVIALQALKEMRLLIYELHPPTLKGDGLVNALQQRLDAVERRANVKTRLLISGEIALPASIASELNRIAQEALNNILKHAAASSVTIHIRSESDHIELEIIDDGRGFDLLQAEDQGGLGLLSLNERTKRLGGSINITSAPGSGTKVSVSIPQTIFLQR